MEFKENDKLIKVNVEGIEFKENDKLMNRSNKLAGVITQVAYNDVYVDYARVSPHTKEVTGATIEKSGLLRLIELGVLHIERDGENNGSSL